MQKIYKGRVWKFDNDVDTDNIIPGKAGTIPDMNEMATHAFELLRPDFAKNSNEGDIIVAGSNFGCGSSREQAPAVIKINGVKIVIAESFARIFFRNSFNIGLILIECKGLLDNINDGDEIEVELNKCIRANGKEYPISKIPDNLFKIVEDGGLVNNIKKYNEKKKQEETK